MMNDDITSPIGGDDGQDSLGDATLEIDRSKPVRSWREFAKEVGIIVLGVLIALMGEQGVEWLHWHQDVRASEETMRDNARSLIASAAEREASSPCLATRLTTISEIVDEASSSGRLPAVNQLGAPARGAFAFISWDNAVAAQIAPHWTREQIGNYASIAMVTEIMKAANADEVADWADLYSIVGPGRRFGDAEQARVRNALSRAVTAAKRLRLYSEQLTRAVLESGLLTRKEVTELRRKAGEDYTRYSRSGIMCKPLDQAPAATHYGQAPSPVDLSQPFQP